MLDAETLRFLSDLKANNTRDWFQANKARYDRVMKTPAKWFARVLADELARRYGTQTVPKVFRVNRDLRFSKDKTPYNAHLHMSVADANGGFAWMVGLEPEGRLVLGYGCFAFSSQRLDRFRAEADRRGGELTKALAGFRLNEPELKRVPAPFLRDHSHGEMLRRKGLAAWIDDVPEDIAFGADGPARVADVLGRFDPLRGWLASAFAGDEPPGG